MNLNSCAVKSVFNFIWREQSLVFEHYIQCDWGYFLGGEAASHEADRSLPFIAKIKNVLSRTSIRPYICMGMVRDLA
jgi:hypothetical protein